MSKRRVQAWRDWQRECERKYKSPGTMFSFYAGYDAANKQKIKLARKLWDALGKVSTNPNDEIEQRFIHFEVYANREEIWRWFEEEFDLSVAEDLMCQTVPGVREAK